MSPAAGSQRRAGRDQRRIALGLRLLEAVERLIAEGESFTTLSVERIAAEAGAGRSTFYLYFQDKTELLQSWFTPISEAVEEANRGWQTIDGTSTKDDLRAILAEIVEAYRTHRSALSIVYDATGYDPIMRDLVSEAMDRTVTLLAKHIRLGQRQGWIIDGILPRETATWLTWMGQRGGHELLDLDDEARLPGLIDGYADVVWGSLYAGAPARLA